MLRLLAMVVLVGCGDMTSHPDAALVEFDYSITLSPTTLTLPAGGSATVTVDVLRTGDMGDVTLSLDSVPAGLTATVSPMLVAKPAHTAQLSITLTTATGTSSVTLLSSGFIRHGEAGGTDRKQWPITVTAQ